ncbi:hypothetical protein TraAM80_01386 [Trypanosoma rangeli]|uniref:Uncharacterized protein n=1 Tax=Trypanosoma rangeli TaxID=5698 RepID=A0A3R7P0F1_TRYRA|nr:uncharacterized protein TraAM80_01386 [Trypanosoma rangeli]RNF10683.1 hypothetical protein TraAM80_01386 [Trypanosoma rangeli]|eukprot:RNF10683.1 hypothetical protein TraAM80_01386 [Trypanosoma rangeli]
MNVFFFECDTRIDQQLSRRCCIFYGASYNTMLLLNSPLGGRLMRGYNTFFQAFLSLRNMPSVVATGVVVLLSALLHRVEPFLERIAELLLANRTTRRSSDFAAIQIGFESGWNSNRTPGWLLDVMRAAPAFSLGLERNYVHVEVPIRHLTERKPEELNEGY